MSLHQPGGAMTTIKYAASALLRRLGCFLFALSACDFARKTKEAPLRLPRAAAGEPPRSGVGTKIVYVIRHGESQWNTAQKRKDPLAMFGQFDHALTMRGVEQAEGLRSRIRSASRYSKARIELERAGIIYCSPLTRALQTALISLAAHPALRSDRAGVVLIPECRELCYPVAGFDSLRGQMGDGIASRAIRRARRVATLRSSDAASQPTRPRDPALKSAARLKSAAVRFCAQRGPAGSARWSGARCTSTRPRRRRSGGASRAGAALRRG
ncbi:histidine phosphatase superfamily [Pelagophyceae sp. CCMP2097]|nr:histidine phosphatase superfamily [Pelagophyceae sp. CCMP2097]